MSIRVKICGLTNLEDARLAVDAGAHAVGFVFAPGTPRFVSAVQVAAWVRQLPPFVSRVALFVNAGVETVREVIRVTGIETVQFHGDEPPEYCRLFQSEVRVLKALRVRGPEILEQLESYENSVDSILLDAWVPGAHGGTGARFDWDLAVEARGRVRSLVLAGGLNPENVADAVRGVRPHAVDVSSGVEHSQGKKDPDRMRRFVRAALDAES